MLAISPRASHLDHNLNPNHLEWLLATFVDRTSFFIETVTIPLGLDPIPCGLYGPAVGDPPVPEQDVYYLVRGHRSCASRVLRRPAKPRPSRLLTVIAGETMDGPCVLYTAYGGPSAPREPGDLTLSLWSSIEESRAFWADHALAHEPPHDSSK